MKLGFVGADHEVTGSCHYLEACGKQILIDCGMEQGKDIYVNQDIPIPINQIDYVQHYAPRQCAYSGIGGRMA